MIRINFRSQTLPVQQKTLSDDNKIFSLSLFLKFDVGLSL